MSKELADRLPCPTCDNFVVAEARLRNMNHIRVSCVNCGASMSRSEYLHLLSSVIRKRVSAMPSPIKDSVSQDPGYVLVTVYSPDGKFTEYRNCIIKEYSQDWLRFQTKPAAPDGPTFHIRTNLQYLVEQEKNN